MQDNNPASLQSGKMRRLILSGPSALKISLSPVNRHQDGGFLLFVLRIGFKVYQFHRHERSPLDPAAKGLSHLEESPASDVERRGVRRAGPGGEIPEFGA